MVALPNGCHLRPKAATLEQADVDRFRQAVVNATASRLSLLNDSVGLRQMKRTTPRWSVLLIGPGACGIYDRAALTGSSLSISRPPSGKFAIQSHTAHQFISKT